MRRIPYGKITIRVLLEFSFPLSMWRKAGVRIECPISSLIQLLELKYKRTYILCLLKPSWRHIDRSWSRCIAFIKTFKELLVDPPTPVAKASSEKRLEPPQSFPDSYLIEELIFTVIVYSNQLTCRVAVNAPGKNQANITPSESTNVDGIVTFGKGGDASGGNSSMSRSSIGESNPVGRALSFSAYSFAFQGNLT